MIEKFACRDFTVFEKLNIEFSSGLNVLIGENGIGKTHLLKACYALSSSGMLKRDGEGAFDGALGAMFTGVFRPKDDRISALCRHGSEGNAVVAADFSASRRVSALIDRDGGSLVTRDDSFPRHYTDNPVYIPSRESMSFMRGFVSIVSRYDLPFDRTCKDMAVLLDLPKLRDDKISDVARRILSVIEKVCGGKFVFADGGAVYSSTDGEECSASCASEGLLKFAVLSRLLENGAIRPGESGPIFWDLPECGLNPKLLKVLAGILLELARSSCQIILATHSYVLLKYLDLMSDPSRGEIRFHILGRGEWGAVRASAFDRWSDVGSSSISEAYANLYDIELEKRR